MGSLRSISGQWKRWLLGAVAVVLLVVVGGPFIYIHFIEGKALAPLKLTGASTTTTSGSAASPGVTSPPPSGATVAVDGTWKVAGDSRAGYRIKESLFGQSNTAVGRTTAVTGTITIGQDTVSAGSFSVDMTQMSSDRSQRDNQFQNRIMDTATFPTATFVLTQPVRLATLPADNVQIIANATGNLNMHGATKLMTFAVMARRSGATIQVSGSIPITFAEWNISNPSGGPANTEDHGILEFLINFARAPS